MLIGMPKKTAKKTNKKKSKKKAKKKVAKKKAKKRAGKKTTQKGKTGPPLGNQFWRMRSTHGRKPIFSSPQQLEDACTEYFQYVETHPLYEAKLTTYQGKSKIEYMPKMRAMTIDGLCIFLDISVDAWSNYRKRDDFIGVTAWAEQIIRDQKFGGASADLLNANIIARDLGLTDKKELDHKGHIGISIAADEDDL